MFILIFFFYQEVPFDDALDVENSKPIGHRMMVDRLVSFQESKFVVESVVYISCSILVAIGKVSLREA